MNYDDTTIDSTIWSCIRTSRNPDDFKAYLAHRPANAHHVEEAELLIQELNSDADYPSPRFPEAVSCIKNLAVAGDATAQFHMGKFCDAGRGVAANTGEAAHWYEMAVAGGEIRAAHNLAIMKLEGQGTPKDVEGAVSLMERGIAAGESVSAEVLGRHFCQKEPLDVDRAIHFLRTAYELGSLSAGERLGRLLYSEANDREQRADAKALLNSLVEKDYMPAMKSLAYILSEGSSSDRDYEAARRLQLRLLESGNKDAMLSLGWLDAQLPPSSSNLPENEPLYWFKKAWEEGLVQSAGHIGRAYLYGEGVEKSVKDAFTWFKLGAENGEAPCAYYIGSIFERGLIDDANDREAEPWFRKAAEAGIQEAQISLARILFRNTGVSINGAEAVKWLSVAIDAGNTEAMLTLAHLYQDGIGVIKNPKAAFDLSFKAALAGNLVGQSETAWRLCRGIGCDINLEESFKWHSKAATSGRAYDQGILAISYLYGELSQVQNYDEAVKWARLSALQGDSMGQLVLGTCYTFGCGVSKDFDLAIEWLTKSAEQGNVRAQVRLAEMFYSGADGLPRDFLKAGRWASQAADAGHPTAQLLLGRMFVYGEHVEADPKAAIEWFRLAAEQDEPEAMYWLGRLTADGVGTKRDWFVALKWLKKAADLGIESAVSTLKSFGVEYVPGSEDRHRLSPDEPVVLDSPFKAELFEGDWECLLDDGRLAYSIKTDGTYSSTADLNETEPVTSEGRWAIRGKRFIWDVWKSNIPLEDPESMDDQIDFISQDELHLTGDDGKTLKFRKQKPKTELGGKVVDFSLSVLKKLWK